MPSARASAPLMASASPDSARAAARPTTMPSGRLCRVTASTIRPQCPAPAPVSSVPAACSSRSRPTAPMTSPAVGGSHAGSGPSSARWMAGSSRLHTLAASMMPAAMPQSIRRVFGSCVGRIRKTPAAPTVVQQAGSSRTAANRKKIPFKTHSPFPPFYAGKRNVVNGLLCSASYDTLLPSHKSDIQTMILHRCRSGFCASFFCLVLQIL